MMRKDIQSESTNDTFIKEANGSAVVVGASLSGLMTGIALSRTGLNVTILERAGAKPRSGAVLQVDSGEIDRTKTAKFLRKIASGGIRSVEAWSSIQFRLRIEAEADPKITLHYDTRVQSVNQDGSSAWVVDR
jgi:2-polyprenyl-6-methoxyphenol hydroxylase-like FAD-dependent oxidoreductase